MKNVFITGADRGLGLALCEIFAQNGWKVFAGKYLDYWKELDELIANYPENIVSIPLDVSSTESVKNAVAKVSELTDCLDMLVNCAGISMADSSEGITATINVNAVGSFRVTELMLPLLEKGMKRICYVSSEAGSVSLTWRKERIVYPTSKASMNMHIRLAFNELRPKGFEFRVYHPGAVTSYILGNDTLNPNPNGIPPKVSAKAGYEHFVGDTLSEDVLIMKDLNDKVLSF